MRTASGGTTAPPVSFTSSLPSACHPPPLSCATADLNCSNWSSSACARARGTPALPCARPRAAADITAARPPHHCEQAANTAECGGEQRGQRHRNGGERKGSANAIDIETETAAHRPVVCRQNSTEQHRTS